MTAEIVNLRHRRKDKRRQDHAAAAAENRVKHGRTSAERDQQTAEAERTAKYLEGHRTGGPSE